MPLRENGGVNGLRCRSAPYKETEKATEEETKEKGNKDVTS